MRAFFDSISHPGLAYASTTLTICLLIVVLIARIAGDQESVRTGAVLAAIFAVMCASTKLSTALGWVELHLLVAFVFASWAQSKQRSFWLWFTVAALSGWVIALAAYKVAMRVQNRGERYGPASLPAAAPS
jgi:hypothetical protein